MSAWTLVRSMFSETPFPSPVPQETVTVEPASEQQPADLPVSWPAHALLEQVLPGGGKPPLERIQELSGALDLAQQIAREVRSRLEGEYGRIHQALQGINRQARPLAEQGYDQTLEGLQGFWQAFQLLEQALSSDDSALIQDSRSLAQEADLLLIGADQELAQAQQDMPLVA